ncbi:alpha/beta hydrolase [Nonomuraea sp. NPDC050310]|uniref:alpha/beta hydrolase n=1 Tax=Nonomuraea sp. NPDC050310 TaxID=3154935 RepID=UPI0034073CAA
MSPHTWAATATITALAGLSGVVSAPAPDRYHRQPITWRACATDPADELGTLLDQAGVQCAGVTVPMDYRRPAGRTITIEISRLKAPDATRRRGVLLINPGGPGATGIQQVLLGKKVPALAERYDLVGMDPRFVGRSTPIRCRWQTDTFLRSAGPDRRSFDAGVALARRLAEGCARDDRSALPYASTRNTARDMDVIRSALGERKLSYLGYSYGTYLGATYLQMFGAHADRVVLDSAVDPETYGPRLLRHNAPALEAALRRWAAWVAGRDGEYGLGATVREVRAAIDKITEKPVQVNGHWVDASVVPYWLFARLYDDGPAEYAALAKEAAALTGRTPPPASLLEFLDGLFTGSGTAEDRAGTPILCADRAAPTNPELYYRDIQRHRAAEPLFGPLVRNISPCAFWPDTPVEPATRIANAVPALIVGAAGDPATPYAGQRAMHRALTGSRMLTLIGSYRHGVYVSAGNRCVDTVVGRYLLDGVLPKADTSCTVSSARPAPPGSEQ